ncbi:5,10-methylenetetrahydromethanopterin reductase [Pseudonocardia sulfidoxydans NBRC 16205]|uniref:5,10-methylenetetrahydromethanopterin reductase n=1 Tax=Pseudonocardia sulfidoxydans NBRC 16205 TaxID=1223511 RepID=A0A511DHC0_9PSEU|nr:LLM class flavin-dependent oxidoreductase [Pseudonocardia sulfidoxydans]GEL23154.1 5,10-methylenetetrahydromethanopterin reductase [Pseudonocardia sulfidoxydans NBRC 16205]
MTEIGLSLGVSPREDVQRFVTLARHAERLGVGHLWVIDSQMAMKDAYVALAVGAWETERVRLGTGVTNLQTRNVTVLANTFATLASMAPGRVLLGLGAGDSAVFPLGLRPSRIAELRTGIRQLRALLRGEETTLPGGAARMPFVPEQPPPIYLSASQPRMLQLAGAEADGVIVMGVADRDLIAAQIAHVARGAEQAGRDPAEVAVDVWVTVSVGDDASSAVDDVRSWASAKARWMSTWADLPPSLEAHRPEMEAAARAYDFGTHLSVRADHAHAVGDELATALAVAGDPVTCARRLADIAQLRPAQLTVALLSGGREQRLETLMAEIAPAIRAAAPDPVSP